MLFALFEIKEACTADLWEQKEGGGGLELPFCEEFNVWELDSVEGFLLLLQGHLVKNKEQKDRVVWKGDGK